jgi:hypothetical protein
MSLRRARRVDEHVERVRQAVCEVADLRDRLEYDAKDMAKIPALPAPLKDGIDAVLRSVQDGIYAFGREDLPVMAVAGRYAHEIPFHTMLNQNNETHRRGLEVEGDDA